MGKLLLLNGFFQPFEDLRSDGGVPWAGNDQYRHQDGGGMTLSVSHGRAASLFQVRFSWQYCRDTCFASLINSSLFHSLILICVVYAQLGPDRVTYPPRPADN